LWYMKQLLSLCDQEVIPLNLFLIILGFLHFCKVLFWSQWNVLKNINFYNFIFC
jgi:hypothetical protein